MKHLFAISGFVIALGAGSSAAIAQPMPPALPSLSQQQTQELDTRIDAYRRATDARVARNEITQDEAARLVAWREWQVAQQLAVASRASSGSAPPDYHENVPPDYRENVPPDYQNVPPDYRDSTSTDPRAGSQPPYYVAEPAPVYVPYYRPAVPYYPYYYGPRPYAYWGPTVCAGGFGRHFGGRICF